MKSEELYVEMNLNLWDRICLWVWLWPMASIIAMIGYGFYIGGYDEWTMLLLGSFVIGLLATIVMRGVLLPRKIKILRLEFEQVTQIP